MLEVGQLEAAQAWLVLGPAGEVVSAVRQNPESII